ncbi:AMP-binding protein [Lutimaribacter saemankumensis]|uniref:Crotonobetaine/carnitine-CoA ligase n=1 Tax=Lutimaribacter saemankumensis TaxID=490829 RepID=A0A1G8K8C2_9RHOB|nr:AMP-binding protein [Lutimaribacter saemankumensis]SDI39661.1 crotonobetaine/carnitine-CoA ligase [Lutimaribacter saemankumensis]
MFKVAASPERPETQDPRVPSRDKVVTRYLIDRLANEQPDKVLVKFDDNGEEWTYAAFREKILRTSIGLQSQGVSQGDHVLVFAPNSREQVLVFFALNYIGAVYVPINTAYKGSLLSHVINISDAKVAFVHASLVDRLEGIDTHNLEKLIVVGGKPASTVLPSVTYETALLPENGELAPLARPIEPWDPMSIIFTSGTTGPSKGVLSSYLHLFTNAGPESWPFVTSEDRYLINSPMFHIGGMGPMFCMLARGASFAMVERFDTTTYWDSVRNTEVTVAFLLGVMATFLEKLPEKDDDKDNPLRLVLMVPLASNAESFSKRFGVDVYTIFNMTEISTPIVSEPNPKVRGTCGKARDGVEVRLVDENDCEVPLGAVGEMLVRTDRPWGMNSGYHKNPEATAKAWRNGWFHTGDAFTQDADGNFFFVDRMKDAIRRRGENISSFEVEAEVCAHPAVREAAAVAVPSELGEDDVLVCVAPVEGNEINPAELIEFLRERMAYFMIPRYIRVLPDLPKTPSAKVLKHELRAEGVTQDTWDREEAGIKVKGERFTKAS